MPGRLIMDQQGAIGSQDLKKDRSQAQEEPLPQKRDFAQMQAAPQTNGPGTHGANGALPNGVSAPTANGKGKAPQTAESMLPTPPLNQEWRTSDANKDMGVMMDRLAQQCFGDLSEVLTTMANTPEDQAQPNGVIAHLTDRNESSLTKKRTLMDFAHTQRDRFTKALVLSDWAKDSDDMARLIDIRVWQEEQANAQRSAIDFIGTTKHGMVRAKMPNPNIEGALELLSTGSTSKIPDLGYLPPKPLTAKQLLGKLRDMNVALATRLNLHEELPPHFNEFSIANGRATFRVVGEFEVDLAIADEDPTMPFYFIDIRFLFSPTPRISDDGLRVVLEQRTNAALATGGLQRCYEFLHSFVLAHKVNILKDQALKLQKDMWFDCLNVKAHEAAVTIQYWTGRPGPKSWIEFGISSGKLKEKRSRKPPTPRNSFRWFRQGQEVTDDAIEVDWQKLDLEAILTVVTAKHSLWSLRSIRERLNTLAGIGSKLESRLHASKDALESCSLDMSLPGLRTPVTLRFEQVTGQFSISPPTRHASIAEHMLNTGSSAEAPASVAQVLCRSVQDRIAQAAHLARFIPVDPSKLSIAPSLRQVLVNGVVRRSMYTCSNAWGSWALYITSGLAGERCFAVRTEEKVEHGKVVKLITTARELPVKNALTAESGISRATMLQLQNLAEAEVSFAVLSQQLENGPYEYRIETTSSLTQGTSAIGDRHPVTAVYFSSTLKKQRGAKLPRPAFPVPGWVRFSHQGVVNSGGDVTVRHELRVSVEPDKFKFLQEYLTDKMNRVSDIAMNDSGALALKMRTPFGQPFIDQVYNNLQRCHQLSIDLQVLNAYKMRCTDLGLTKFGFVYSSIGDLTIKITYNAEGTASTVKLEPADNPHNRIRRPILEMLRKPNQLLKDSIGTLKMTTPLLRLFDKLEKDHAQQQSLITTCRSAKAFTLTYRSPMPACKFEITLDTIQEPGGEKTLHYRFQTNLDKPVEAMQDSVKQALLAFSASKGTGWVGDQRGGFWATIGPSVGGAVYKLDETLRNAAGAKQEAPVGDSKPKPTPSSGPPAKAPQQQRKKPSAQNQTARPGQGNAAAGRAGQQQQNKMKQEVIELD